MQFIKLVAIAKDRKGSLLKIEHICACNQTGKWLKEHGGEAARLMFLTKANDLVGGFVVESWLTARASRVYRHKVERLTFSLV